MTRPCSGAGGLLTMNGAAMCCPKLHMETVCQSHKSRGRSLSTDRDTRVCSRWKWCPCNLQQSGISYIQGRCLYSSMENINFWVQEWIIDCERIDVGVCCLRYRSGTTGCKLATSTTRLAKISEECSPCEATTYLYGVSRHPVLAISEW